MAPLDSDLVLLQAHVAQPWRDAGVAALEPAIAACWASTPTSPLGMAAQLRRIAWSPSLQQVYVYLEPVAGRASDVDALREHFAQRNPWATQVTGSRLEQVFDTPGASHGAPAHFHYVVEMDPEDGWMPEIARWYNTEHMPGLAAVPGCIRATRFLNHGHGPLSLACYDLTHAEALGSPPWLAVRATPWSDITRPHFTNTKRTMFQVPVSHSASSTTTRTT